MLSSRVVTHKLTSNFKYLNLKLNKHIFSAAGVYTSLQFICLQMFPFFWSSSWLLFLYKNKKAIFDRIRLKVQLAPRLPLVASRS